MTATYFIFGLLIGWLLAGDAGARRSSGVIRNPKPEGVRKPTVLPPHPPKKRL